MNKSTQLRATVRGMIAEGRIRPGQTFWVADLVRARLLVDQGIAEPVVGPAEFKESAEKKPLSDGPATPSTDSAPSSESGPEPSSAAPADPVSPKPKRKRSKITAFFAEDE